MEKTGENQRRARTHYRRRRAVFVGIVETAGRDGGTPIRLGRVEPSADGRRGGARSISGRPRPFPPRDRGRWAGLDGTATSATQGPPSRPAHWPPPRFSLATLTRLAGRTRRAHIAHARRTSHRAHDDRRRHNRAGLILAHRIPYTEPAPIISRPPRSHSFSSRPYLLRNKQ